MQGLFLEIDIHVWVCCLSQKYSSVKLLHYVKLLAHYWSGYTNLHHILTHRKNSLRTQIKDNSWLGLPVGKSSCWVNIHCSLVKARRQIWTAVCLAPK